MRSRRRFFIGCSTGRFVPSSASFAKSITLRFGRPAASAGTEWRGSSSIATAAGSFLSTSSRSSPCPTTASRGIARAMRCRLKSTFSTIKANRYPSDKSPSLNCVRCNKPLNPTPSYCRVSKVLRVASCRYQRKHQNRARSSQHLEQPAPLSD